MSVVAPTELVVFDYFAREQKDFSAYVHFDVIS
jgi:hypothetical protein